MEYIKEQKKKSVFKTYLIYFLCMLSFVGVRICGSLGVFSNLSDNAFEIVYTLLIEVVVLFLLPLVLYCLFIRVKPKQVFATCNFNKCNTKTIIVSVLLGIILYLFTIIISTFFNGIIALFGYSRPSSGVEMTLTMYLIQIVTVAILPAICEEFIHRGLLLQGTKHIGFNKSIIITGILFGLIHLNITQVFYAAILGILIGYIAVISKNIWPAIIVHFMNNFISITSSYLQTSNAAYANFMDKVYASINQVNFFVLVLVITIFIAILLVLTYYLMSKLYKYSIIDKVNRAINEVYNEDGAAKSNAPINLGNLEVRRLVESTTTLNLDFSSIKSPIDILMPKQTKIYRRTYKDKIFLKASVLLGVIITIFTFVWGVI